VTTVERLRELVTDAWRMRSPDELVSDLDQAGTSFSADPAQPGPDRPTGAAGRIPGPVRQDRASLDPGAAFIVGG
jgi:hypothetical protein